MDILLIMNAQNSFLSKKGSVYMGEKAEIFKVRLKDYLGTSKLKKVFFREKHAIRDEFFTNDKTHSIAVSNDFKLEGEMTKYADFVYDKTRYSGFYETGLQSFLIRQKVNHVGLLGLETHTSVLFTAEELRNRGFQVTLIEPCTMARDTHMHNYALSLMANFLGIHIGG